MKTHLKKLTTMAGLSLGTLGVITSFQNCGNAGFEAIGQLEKEQLIAKTSVFESNYVRIRAENTNSMDTVNTVIAVTNDNTGLDIPVKYHCSTNAYKNQKRLLQVTEAFAEVRKEDGTVVCDDRQNQHSSLIDFKKFRISSSCQSKLVAGKNYRIRIYEPSSPATSVGALGSIFSGPAPAFAFDGKSLTPQAAGQSFTVLYDNNPQLTASVTHNLCDIKASPLVVLLGESSGRIELTPPSKGILFDILGKKSTPAHSKKRISWFLNNNHNYYFIALPNAQGEVTGIDQLFGDNTFGPDGKFAANGYAALAKFDSNGDSYITEKDAVFQKLRLWHDSDLDGLSTEDELFTLDELNVMTIDLKFDSSYREADIYGNETLMKSAVKTRDGQLHLLFDLWFRHIHR